MQLGMIGLGRMGANMVRRLLNGGHQCVAFDRSTQAVAALVKEKAIGAKSLAEFAKQLTKPRAIWLMVPVGAVDDTIADLLPHLERGDVGYLHCGPNGAGHFVKMVHNGIEYGLMAAYAEGLAVLKAANVGKKPAVIDAETTPLRDPQHYKYDLNLADITEVWRRGSVIASWLLDLTATALIQDPALTKFAGRVSDSGEGRWTIKAGIDEGVPVHVLSSALYERFSSRGEADFADKLLSAMRYEFGGHVEKPAAKRVG